MKSIRTLCLFIFIFFNVSGFCLAEENVQISNISQENIYVTHDQLLINNEGIFLITEKGLVFIPQINQDENGIYINSNVLTAVPQHCPQGHRITCWRCRGCSDRRDCFFRCRCYH